MLWVKDSIDEVLQKLDVTPDIGLGNMVIKACFIKHNHNI